VIWRTDDWDYEYTLDILKFQLENQAKYLENGHLVNAQYNADRIRLALRLMDLGFNDGYQQQVHDEYEEQYGPARIVTKKYEDSDDLYEIEIWYANAKDAKHNEEIHEGLMQDTQWARFREQRARELFFAILSKDMVHWWD
jgi:hypothetical protein